MSVALAEDERSDVWLRPRSNSAFARAVTDIVTIVRPIVSPANTASAPTWIAPVRRRMVELHALARNWDGRGSAAVRYDVLEFTLSVLSQVMTPSTIAPSITPLGNGGVQLAWLRDSAEIEVEVVRPNEAIIYYFDRTSGLDKEGRAETDFSELSNLLRAEFTP